MALPSAVPERPSALKLLVLFFRRCFLRLACGEGGGSILGLVVLEILGLEHTESPRPVSTRSNTHGRSFLKDFRRVPMTSRDDADLCLISELWRLRDLRQQRHNRCDNNRDHLNVIETQAGEAEQAG